jgi:hypothetical protein
MLDTPRMDCREVTTRSLPDAQSPESEPGAVDQLLHAVQDLEGLEARGWRLVSIACQEDEPGQPMVRVVLSARVSSVGPEIAPSTYSVTR